MKKKGFSPFPRTAFRAFLCAAALFASVQAALGDIVCGTWNLKWFPSGRAEHRAGAEKESANTSEAARILSESVSAMRGNPGDGVIVFLQELRDGTCATSLVERTGIKDLRVASVSAFKNRDRRLGWQQCAIATTLPVLASGFSLWRQSHGQIPPRGYAWALLECDGGPVACLCVHLKSNYGDVTDIDRMSTWLKRMVSAAQLMEDATALAAPDGRRARRFIVAGDFNTDVYAPEFDAEKTVRMFFADGWRDAFEGVAEADRATHPGRGRYRSSILDYILLKNWDAPSARRIFPASAVSDHNAVFVRIPAGRRKVSPLPVSTVEEETLDGDGD